MFFKHVVYSGVWTIECMQKVFENLKIVGSQVSLTLDCSAAAMQQATSGTPPCSRAPG